jgi:hypothetical protein
MKDKTIKDVHFEYVNELVKMLGFRNLADFESAIPYNILKTDQEKICLEFNKTINEFKKLFPQEGFDLRKINYSFENIDQIIGFVKKLFNYLGITWDYSRKNGIPTLRLIPPNNLYNKYIMNLRNIPQKEDFYLFKKNDLCKDIKIEMKEDNYKIEMKEDKLNKYVVSEWSNSTITPDFMLNNKNVEMVSNDFMLYESKVSKENKTPIIKITELQNRFEKKEISKKYILDTKFNLDIIQMDWIEQININYLDMEEKKLLPIDTIISLVVDEEEIILHTISNEKLNDIEKNNNFVKINLPNKFLYHHNSVYLQIYLPENKFNDIENLTNELKFEIEFNGYDILNKDSLLSNIDLNTSIIEFDHDSFYSPINFDLGIYHMRLGINQYHKNNNIDQNIIFNIGNSNTLSMKYVMDYLKKPYEKKYIIGNLFNLENLSEFNYFRWIKIRNIEKNKLANGFVLQLLIGGNVELEYEINPDTIFDLDNYFKFEIDFPNKFLHKYHELHFKICPKNNNSKNYDVIINGCDFRSTIPKMFSNSNIVFNHDSKWYIQGEKEYICICGTIGNRFNNKPSQNSIINTDRIKLFKKLKDENIVDIFDIELPFSNGKKEICVFINTDLKNLYKSTEYNPLMFLYDSDFKKYLEKNNLLKTDSFSFGSNELVKSDTTYDICEVIGKSLLKLHYIIQRHGDMIKHIDLYIKNYSSKLNKLDKYKINVWIEYESNKIYDFGFIDIEDKIRLVPPNKKIINLLRTSSNLYLVIEIPDSKCYDWNHIDISLGLIYAETATRRTLAQLKDYLDVQII